MTPVVIDREAMPETDEAYIDAPNPDDYDNDTDYLNAIPGMMESIMASINAPKSERVPSPKDWIDRDA